MKASVVPEKRPTRKCRVYYVGVTGEGEAVEVCEAVVPDPRVRLMGQTTQAEVSLGHDRVAHEYDLAIPQSAALQGRFHGREGARIS